MPIRNSDEYTDASGGFAPHAQMAAERLKEPADANDEKKLPAMFEIPWPMNSWLVSTWCPVRSAIPRATLTASVNARIVVASATGAVLRMVSSDQSGCESGGSCDGSTPTVAIRVTSAPNR